MRPGTEADIGPGGEAEWQRLRRQVELAEGFWLGFIFSPSPLSSEVLRRRTERFLLGQTRLLRSIRPKTPAELVGELSTLFAPELATAGCIWMEAIHLDPDNRTAQPWKEAWLDVVSRMNERRDALRRHLHGGIILVAPPEMKPFMREAASDLWSIRALVVEIPSVPESATPRTALRPETTTVRTATTKTAEVQALAAFTLEEAARVLPREHADDAHKLGILLSKVDALLSTAQTGEAVETARQARELALNSQRLTESQQAIAAHKLAQAEKANGDVAAAEDHLEQALGTLGDHDQGYRASLLDELATIALHRGDLELALSSYEKMLDIDRQLHAHAGSTAETDLLLAYSLGKSGDIHLRLGHLSSASAAYAECLALTRRLHVALGDTPESLRALAVSLEKVGTAQRQSGNFAAAHASYAESLAFARQVRTMLGDTPETLLSLFVSLDREGLAQQRMGNTAAANSAYQEAFTLANQLRATLGDTPEVLRDLSVCFDRMGDLQHELGNLSGANEAYGKSLALRQQLRLIAGDTPETLSLISNILNRLGDVQQDAGNLSAAHTSYNESLSLMRQLHESMGDAPEVIRDTLVTIGRLGGIQAGAGNLSAAHMAYEEALGLARRRHELTGGTPQAIEDLQVALRNIASVRELLGDQEGAVRAIKESEALSSPAKR